MERILRKTAKLRQLKVYTKHVSKVGFTMFRDPATGTNSVPEIRLQGEWLRKLGFHEGSDITVLQMPKILIITLNEETENTKCA